MNECLYNLQKTHLKYCKIIKYQIRKCCLRMISTIYVRSVQRKVDLANLLWMAVTSGTE